MLTKSGCVQTQTAVRINIWHSFASSPRYTPLVPWCSRPARSFFSFSQPSQPPPASRPVLHSRLHPQSLPPLLAKADDSAGRWRGSGVLAAWNGGPRPVGASGGQGDAVARYGAGQGGGERRFQGAHQAPLPRRRSRSWLVWCVRHERTRSHGCRVCACARVHVRARDVRAQLGLYHGLPADDASNGDVGGDKDVEGRAADQAS